MMPLPHMSGYSTILCSYPCFLIKKRHFLMINKIFIYVIYFFQIEMFLKMGVYTHIYVIYIYILYFYIVYLYLLKICRASCPNSKKSGHNIYMHIERNVFKWNDWIPTFLVKDQKIQQKLCFLECFGWLQCMIFNLKGVFR